MAKTAARVAWECDAWLERRQMMGLLTKAQEEKRAKQLIDMLADFSEEEGLS